VDVGAEDEFRWDGADISPRDHPSLTAALETGVLCNNASLGDTPEDSGAQAVGDPLEVALLVAGRKAGLLRPALTADRPEMREEAFDADVKMMATFHQTNDGFEVAVKGAPEPVLEASTHLLTADGVQTMGPEERSAWMTRNEALAATHGLRVLALATKATSSLEDAAYADLTFIGLVGLEDPPRKDVRDAIDQCHRAGIEVVMVTGDQPVTALAVGREVGLAESDDEPVVHGSELKPPVSIGDEERQRFLQTRLFARVTPKQKLDLIGLHQDAGRIVAMTGDGVNDAPALKQADIGIAMGQRGTQVAQEAADMVLQDDAFSSIVAAVREGRAIFENIRTFVLYLMSCNVSEVMVVGAASLVGTTLPILPLQILFLNLVTDVFPALALGVGEGETDLMDRRPRNPTEPILSRQLWLRVAFYGFVFTVAVLGSLLLAQKWLRMDTDQAVTVSFLTLGFSQLWHVFNMRGPHSGLFRNEITRNPHIWGALGLCTGLMLIATYVPGLNEVLNLRAPGPSGWGLVLGMSLVPLGVGQAAKYVTSGWGSPRRGPGLPGRSVPPRTPGASGESVREGDARR
ncbi:MAG: cation-transporting P-type ATPase, partial [Gemmatimonadetes bacterium]|nr:cation-transporting P-type ATPase [Gemmatimonadota bacterium]